MLKYQRSAAAAKRDEVSNFAQTRFCGSGALEAPSEQIVGRGTYAPLSAFERANFVSTFGELQHHRQLKYQLFLASAIGLPKDDTGRTEIMGATMTVLEKIRAEIRALEHELDRREDQEKRRL